jgi:hypothetical protein
MMDGTSPSIAQLNNGSYEIAFQANSGWLWTVGADGWNNSKLGIDPPSSPSIAGAPGGGYEATFSSYGPDALWDYGSAGTNDFNDAMEPGTSPSIAALSSGGYELAYTTSADKLGHMGADGTAVDDYGLWPGTSPNIARQPNGGFEIAFKAYGSGDLWVVGSAANLDTGIVTAPNTSPSIAELSSGSYEVAYHGVNGDVWTYSPSTGVADLGVPMMAGTNPSIIGLSGGGAEVAIQANTGWLWEIGPSGQTNTHLGLNPKSSPSVASLPNNGYEVAFQSYVAPPPSAGATPITPPPTPPRKHSKKHSKHHVRVKISLAWVWHGPVTELTKLRFSRLPRRARVTISCTGRGCPRARSSATASHVSSLRRQLVGRRFDALDKLRITISARGELPEVAVLAIRDGHEPSARLVG